MAINRAAEGGQGWERIGGQDVVKRRLLQALKQPLQFPDLFNKFKLNGASGVLLHGPAGCGKTLLGEALAAECKANFLRVKAAELLSPTIGESEANIRALFRNARQSAPCIIFFDELDGMARGGGSSPSSASTEGIIQTLCSEWESLRKPPPSSTSSAGPAASPPPPVFIVGATNRPDLLDRTLLQPHFFAHKLHVGLPDSRGRKVVFEALLQNTPLEETVTSSNGAYLGSLAAKLKGFSGADIASVCHKACRTAIQRTVKAQSTGIAAVEEVLMSDLEQASKTVSPSVTEETISLHQSFQAAMGGEGGVQIGFGSGGIGKTSGLDDLLRKTIEASTKGDSGMTDEKTAQLLRETIAAAQAGGQTAPK